MNDVCVSVFSIALLISGNALQVLWTAHYSNDLHGQIDAQSEASSRGGWEGKVEEGEGDSHSP